MCRIIFLLLLLTNIVSSGHDNTITTTLFNDMESNMEFADALADAVNPVSFPLFLTSTVTSGFKLITSTISLFNTLLKLKGTNEALPEIKRMYTEMTTRFDSVDRQLKDIKREIQWSSFTSKLRQIEQNVNANYDQRIKDIITKPPNITDDEKIRFIKTFENTCLNCATILYRGLMGEDKILVGDILRNAEPLLNNSRPKMHYLMKGFFQLLTKAITAELLYDSLVHNDTLYFKIHKNEWSGKIQNLTTRMTLVDNEVKNKWNHQASTDIDYLSGNKTSESNQVFSKTVYDFLNKKYYWRDWLVIVYKPIWLAKNHNNFVCEGYRKYRLHGRNIVVESVENNRPIMNKTGLKESILNTRTIEYYTEGPCQETIASYTVTYNCRRERRFDAAHLYANLPKNCSMYASVGVIDSWVDLWYQGPTERLVHMRTPGKNSYSLHYFG